MYLGRGIDQVVSVLAFYSDDLSSNPAEAYSFFCNIVFEKNENKQKEAGVSPLFLKKYCFVPRTIVPVNQIVTNVGRVSKTY